MFKVVLLKYSTYTFIFHTFIFVLANAYLYKSYDHFLTNTKEYKHLWNLDKYIASQYDHLDS